MIKLLNFDTPIVGVEYLIDHMILYDSFIRKIVFINL